MDYASRDRFLPCLLVRLKGGRDPAPPAGMAMGDYRNAVMLDLSRLLNARSQPTENTFDEFKITNATPGTSFYKYPEVANSVLNYGFSDLAGLTRGHLDLQRLRKRLTEIIKLFEPRILSDSLKITISEVEDDDPGSLIRIEIQGKLWAKPVPEEILRRGELDLINGEFRLSA